MSRHYHRYGALDLPPWEGVTSARALVSRDSPALELWQRFLIRNGYPLRSGCDDGVWGPSTQEATSAFRASQGFSTAPPGIALYDTEVPAATRLGYGSIEYAPLTAAERSSGCPPQARGGPAPSRERDEEVEEEDTPLTNMLPDALPDKVKGTITEVAEKVISPEGAMVAGGVLLAVAIFGIWRRRPPGSPNVEWY